MRSGLTDLRGLARGDVGVNALDTADLIMLRQVLKHDGQLVVIEILA